MSGEGQRLTPPSYSAGLQISASRGSQGVGVFLPAKVGGVDCSLLVDTGAQVSVVAKEFWQRATGGKSTLEPYTGTVSAANGGPMSIMGKWAAACQINSLALVIDFLVADIPLHDVLLGTDFLLKFGAVINLGERCCEIMGKRLPLLYSNLNNQVRRVVVQEDVIVPPCCEIILPGSVEGVFEEPVEGLLEPATGVAEDILIARALCRVKKGVLPLRVLNVTEGELLLRKGTTVGTLDVNVDVLTGEESETECMTGVAQWTSDSLMAQFGLDNKGLTKTQLQAVRELFNNNVSVFSRDDSDLGRTHLTHHQIDTGQARPIKMAPRRVPLHLQQEVSEHIKQMQGKGIIQPSCSPWAAPVVPVRKKDGGLRFCVDYRKLNEVTKKDAYPLPRIDDALDSLHSAQWFSTLDLASGYWQVEVDPQDRPKTAFTTRQGLFEFNVLPFGLTNSPSTFQRLMDLVLADLQWTTCLVYLDDIIVFGRDFAEHLQRLDQVLSKLKMAHLKVKPAKCNFFSTKVHYLGHVISAEGVMADPEKVEAVRGWPTPKNQTEVRSFLGLASYYRRFVKGFAEIARPLHKLTEKGRRFQWDEACQEAFVKLKTCLISAPVLAYPDPQKSFILDTDASDTGIGAVLSQEVDGLERVVAYASRALTKQERKYATTKKELLGVVAFTKYFKHFLLGKEFLLRTDHNSLRWLHNFHGIEGQLARWLEQLAAFQYKIVHRPGKLHTNVDALSRLPGYKGDLPGSTSQICAVDQKGGELPPERGEPTSDPLDDDALTEAQHADPELKLLMKLKGQNGDRRVALNTYPDLKKFGLVWDQLKVQGRRLVRVLPAKPKLPARTQLVLPASLVPVVLQQLHDKTTGAHLGVQKIQGKIRDRFYWPGWFQRVKKWCQDCGECGSQKQSGATPRAPMVTSATSAPFERIAIDILGPLPKTERSNVYIMVVGDYFSKWTEAYPIPNQEAETLARVLMNEWVSRYGTPRSLHSDQGRSFESNLFQQLCRLLDISKTRTTPYHPQSDGMIERFNRTLLSMLVFYVDENQQNWDSLLPFVMMAYRSSVNATTGFTPHKVLFGREMVLPIDVMLNIDVNEKFPSAKGYVERLTESLSTVLEAVKKHQARASENQKFYFDFKAQHQSYSVGEFVWVRNKARKKGVSPKLQKRFKGPFRVIERVSDVLYRIQPEGGVSSNVVHFNLLKPCVSPTVTEPMPQLGAQVHDQPATGASPQLGRRGERPPGGASRVFRRSRGPAVGSTGAPMDARTVPRVIPSAVGGSQRSEASTGSPARGTRSTSAPVVSDGVAADGAAAGGTSGSSAAEGLLSPEASAVEDFILPPESGAQETPEVAGEESGLSAALAAGGSCVPVASAGGEVSWPSTTGEPGSPNEEHPQPELGTSPGGSLLPGGPAAGDLGRPERARRRPAWCQDYVVSL